ncbi:MAG: hypothetical protein GKR94_24385 [Gammaproteobacteria bacterium]|nr:hypothetical protein [Gammaproteobacteria bacterium]
MTAEVAILNKAAVVLASDSAMTLGESGKVYPTNKLFTLSKYHPVGVMVYNNAEFMGVPWETLVKMFREQLGHEDLPTVNDYVEAFFNFLLTAPICDAAQRESNLLRIAEDLFGEIRIRAVHQLQDLFNTKGRYSTRDISQALSASVDACINYCVGLNSCSALDTLDVDRLLRSHRNQLSDCADHVFSGFQLSQAFRRKLTLALASFIRSKDVSDGSSSVVVAGFGADELFTTLAEIETDGVLGDRLKHEIIRSVDIGRASTKASIIPFAQSEMVHRFMEGVDYEFLDYLGNSAEQLLYQFGKEVLDAHSPLSGARKRWVLKGLRSAAQKRIEAFSQDAQAFRRQKFVTPITEIVAHLPKEELASMAETLVGLTSLKRRVSAEQETVGGPVDVAVISKGDGFVWIKRKHYFNPQLNPQFLHNYFYRTDHAENTP